MCLFPFSEEPGNFYCMEDRKLYDALYYYPDNMLGKGLSKQKRNKDWEIDWIKWSIKET